MYSSKRRKLLIFGISADESMWLYVIFHFNTFSEWGLIEFPGIFENRQMKLLFYKHIIVN